MSTFAAQIVDHLRRATQGAFEAARPAVIQDVRRSISDPFPPASSPGSPPHRRTGNLRDGVDGDVVPGGDTGGGGTPGAPCLAVWSDRVDGDPRVPEILERGNEHIRARPYMEPAFYRVARWLPSLVAGHVGQGGGR